jgi:DNA-binding NarL/FixJ family response regulator
MDKKVLLAGGPSDVAELLRATLSDGDASLVECTTGLEAREALRAEGPEVIIAAETLPGDSGVSLLRFARERRPTCVRMLLLDEQRPETLIDAVNSAEIFRFLVPPLNQETVRPTLLGAFVIGRVAEAQEAVWIAAKQQQEAMEGLLAPGRPIGGRSVDVAAQSNRHWAHGPAQEGRLRADGLRSELADRLSTREKQIVQFLARGQRVKDIALAMGISTHTVRNHLKAIYRKLNVRSQFELLSLLTRP